MRRLGGALIVVVAVCCASASPRPQDERAYDNPIDAISVGFTAKTDALEVSGFDGSTWSDWTPVAVEDEQDPTLLESNLVMFPRAVSRVRFRGTASNYVDHPIRIAHGSMRLEVAALGQVPEPTIYARSSWGADETLRYSDSTTSAPSQDAGDTGNVPSDTDTLTEREKTCLEAQKKYPLEFRTNRTISTQGGKDLRWPLQYSASVKMLVVHHTAQNLDDDARSGPELMRALYQYHAVNRGWGDIGYNFVIDPQGKIYEGRAGGSSVVAGHAYCNNIGTVGIALMGNYEVSTPPMEQIKSLQWLIGKLADSYDIDLSKSVTYHGIEHAAVVGHRDLLSTDCPGYYLYGTIGQMISNVRNGDWTASVRFPVARSSSSSRRSYSSRSYSSVSLSTPRLPDTPAAGAEDTIIPVGETQIVGRPSQVFNFSVQYTAGKAYRSGTRIADVSLSPASMLLWQERDGRMIRIHSALVLPFDLRKGQTARLQLRIQVPDDEGTYSFVIGGVSYAIRAEGRRVPTPVIRSSSSSTSRSAPRSEVLPTAPRPYVPRSSSSASASRAASSLPSTYQQAPALPSSSIRIRLTLTAGTATLTAPKGTSIGGSVSDGSPITLVKDGDTCSADQSGHNLAFGTLRIDAGDSPIRLSHGKISRRYRGIIECRVYDNALTIINEIPVEDYMAGIGEEPDTELYEKQRAFAIAARSYAVYYMSPDHRKFPGAPYDGSDNPADFQLYVGSDNETANPRWVQAVEDTALQVGVIDGGVVRLPYFSADDGRTRAPEEAGWKNFPHATVFSSKEDPWCKGETLRGHGVGMSGCGAKGQAADGKSAESILAYYYPGVTLQKLRSVIADR